MITMKPTPIIILGMHRSGTSCLAGAMQQAGLYLGSVSEYNPYNKKGNREHNDIMQLNDMILNYNNASWDKPPQTSLEWTQEHENMARELISNFENNATTGYWGFKDPRTLLTFSFWEKMLQNPIFIGTFRNPINVAYSLCKRKGSTLKMEDALSLWEIYNNRLISKLDQFSIAPISFDQPPLEYQKKLIKIANLLKLPTANKIDFYDENLVSKNQALGDTEKEKYFAIFSLNMYKKLVKLQF